MPLPVRGQPRGAASTLRCTASAIRSWVGTSRSGCIGRLSTSSPVVRRRAATVGHREVPVGRLLMERPGVVDRRRHPAAAGAGQCGRGRTRIVYCAHAEVRPSGTCRHADHVGQCRAVAGGYDLCGPSSSLGKIDSFSSRMAACSVSSRPLMPIRALSYLSFRPCTRRRPQHRSELGVVAEHRAAVAVAAERLGREERSWRHRASARRRPPGAAAEALRRVGDDPQPMRRRRCGRSWRSRRAGRKVDRRSPRRREDPAGPTSMPAEDARGSRLNVTASTSTKTGVAPSSAHDLGGGSECEGRHQHRVARLTPRAMSARASASVPLAQETTWGAPEKAGQLLLELRDLGAHDVLAVVEHPGDGRVDPRGAALAGRRDR